MLRRTFLTGIAASAAAHATAAFAVAPGKPTQLRDAARKQIGITKGYDAKYTAIPYPNGDVPRTTGVCCDVIVRAYRDAFTLDLQQLVHEDMTRAFTAYPKGWGNRHPDANIDHRRVPNLETFWQRAGAQLWHASANTAGDAFPQPLAVGDLLTWRLNAQFPHVAVVSDTSHGLFGTTVRVVHNWGNGAEELPLADFAPHRAIGHFRWAVS